MANTSTRKQRLEWLRMRSPSMLRSTVLMWLLNAFGVVLGIFFIILAILLAINASIGQKLLQWVINSNDAQQDTSRINWVFAGAAAAMGILCFMIANLSRKVNRRTWHIAELEAVTEEEDPKGK
jgi:hypothetical protein